MCSRHTYSGTPAIKELTDYLMTKEAIRRHTNLQGVVLPLVHDVQDESGQHVEALTVADLLVPARVREQHALQHGPLLVIVRTTEAATTRPVQVL